MLFRGLGIGLSCMHRAVAMLRRRIDGVQPQGLVAGIHDVVAGACRHDDRIVAFDLRTLAVDHDRALALFNPEELVPVVVDLFADLSPGLDRHQDQLQVLARVEHSPKIAVLFRQFLNVRNESLHLSLLQVAAEMAPREGARHGPIRDYLFAIMFFIKPATTVRIAPPAPPPTSCPTMEPTSSPPPATPAIAGINACSNWPPPTPPIAPAIVLPTPPRLAFLRAEPAAFPPRTPATSWIIRLMIVPDMMNTLLSRSGANAGLIR